MSIKERVDSLVRPEVRALSAYKTVDPGNCIKLDAMENPYGWPQEMLDDWLQRLRSVEVNRYPDPEAKALKQAIYSSQGVSERFSLLLGNGSDEIIQIILMAIASEDAVVMAPEPTFVMYRQIARSLGLKFVGVPLQEDFSLDFDAMCKAIEKYRPAVLFLAYPNNPTGNLFDAGEIETLIKKTAGLVVVDEAYAPFTDETFIARVGEFENLLVMRTFSKLGLAGLRLGYLVGADGWIEQLEKLRLPYNIGSLTQACAEFALDRLELFEEQTSQIRKDRQLLLNSLAAIEGLEPMSSEANFVLFRVRQEGMTASELHECLKSTGILIKNLHGSAEALTDCLRVTVGTPSENERVISEIANIFKK